MLQLTHVKEMKMIPCSLLCDRVGIVVVVPVVFSLALVLRLIIVICRNLQGHGMRQGYSCGRMRVVQLKSLPRVFSRNVVVVGGQ